MKIEAIEERVKKIIKSINHLIECIRDTENYEKGIVKNLIEKEWFQEFLKKLEKFLEPKDYKHEWETNPEYITYYTIRGSDATIIEQDDKLIPGFIVDEGYWNQSHSLWYYKPVEKPVETLEKLLEWFSVVRRELEIYFTQIAYRIKNSVKELRNL